MYIIIPYPYSFERIYGDKFGENAEKLRTEENLSTPKVKFSPQVSFVESGYTHYDKNDVVIVEKEEEYPKIAEEIAFDDSNQSMSDDECDLIVHHSSTSREGEALKSILKKSTSSKRTHIISEEIFGGNDADATKTKLEFPENDLDVFVSGDESDGSADSIEI